MPGYFLFFSKNSYFLYNTYSNEEAFMEKTYDEINQSYDILIKLDDLFKTHTAEKALYTFLQNRVFVGENKKYSDELNKLFLDNMTKTDDHGMRVLGGNKEEHLNLEAVIQNYLIQRFPDSDIYKIVNEDAIHALKTAEGNEYFTFLDAFQNGQLVFMDENGKMHSGLSLVKDIVDMENKCPEIENVQSIVSAFVENNRFNIENYNRFYATMMNPYTTNEEMLELYSAKKTNVNYIITCKKILDEVRQRERDFFDEKYNHIIERLDNIVKNELSGERAENFFEIMRDGMNPLLTSEEQTEFEAYFQEVLKLIPNTSTDKIKDTYKLINKMQDERLSYELSNIDKEDEYSKKFIACVLDVQTRQKEIKALEDVGFMYGDFHSANDIHVIFAKLSWALHNTAKACVDECSKKITKQQYAHVQKKIMKLEATIHNETEQNILYFAQQTFDLQNQLLSYTENSVRTQNTIAQTEKLAKQLAIARAQLSATDKRYQKQKEEREKLLEKMKKIEYRQMKTNIPHSLNYLNKGEFKNAPFNDAERCLLRDFSIATKRCFTLNEANILLASYVASNGAFNPQTVTSFGIKGGPALNISVDLSKGPFSIKDDEQKLTFYKMIRKNMIDLNIHDEMTKIFGRNPVVQILPYEKQEFLKREYSNGVDISILESEIIKFARDKEYTIEDSKKSILAESKSFKSQEDVSFFLVDTAEKNKEFENIIQLACKTAAKYSSQIKCEYKDKDDIFKYTITTAKNGKQYMLKIEDLQTGDLQIIRNHRKINDIVSNVPYFAQQISISVAKVSQDKYEETMKARKDRAQSRHDDIGFSL